MKFTKMHGCGNDYVYINCFEEKIENPSELAVKVSNRHFGVGSDGLILICPSDKADFRMDMYNADGSQSEMCGNGIRCVGKYVYDYGLTDKDEVSVETLAGIKCLKFQIGDGKVQMITVDMGEPELIAANVPVISENEKAIDEEIVVDGTSYHMTCVSMGNPHCVVFVDSTTEFPLEEIGPKFESHERFPRRVNAEFVQVLSENEVNMRVWERGTGETLACGTGTCATAVACVLNGKTKDEVKVHLLGGDLIIKWDRQTNHIYMTGPAAVVFDGAFCDTAIN